MEYQKLTKMLPWIQKKDVGVCREIEPSGEGVAEMTSERLASKLDR